MSMAGLKFSSFGAATMPLSKIIPDKDFDIRPYGITAAFARVPYRPIDWETETLSWGDIGPQTKIYLSGETAVGTEGAVVMSWTPTGNHKWKVYLENKTAWYPVSGYIRIDGVNSYTIASIPAGGNTTVEFHSQAGKLTEVYLVSSSGTGMLLPTSYRQNLGIVVGPKTFDLTGKWLALGIDMKGLAATVKIQGVEMPYSDYELYFPLAPTELTIPGDWDISQERPVIEVYK